VERLGDFGLGGHDGLVKGQVKSVGPFWLMGTGIGIYSHG